MNTSEGGVFIDEDVIPEPQPGADGAGIIPPGRTAVGYGEYSEPPSDSGSGFVAPEYEEDPQYKAAADYLLGVINGTVEAKYEEYPNMEEVVDFQVRFGNYSFAALQFKQVLTAPQITNYVTNRAPTIPNIVLEKLLIAKILNRTAFRPSYRREFLAEFAEQMAKEIGVQTESLGDLKFPFIIDKVLKGQLVIYSPHEDNK